MHQESDSPTGARRLRSPRALTVAVVLAATAATVAIGASTPAAAQPAPAVPTSHATVTSAIAGRAMTANYWTPARMRAARSLDTRPVSPAAAHAAQAQARPAGPAGAIAGTAPSTTAKAPLAVRPQVGGIGTPWPGPFFSPPATTSGKVFFQDHLGGNWVCSGSAVNSGGLNAVFTAGHCVFGTAGGELPAGETWHANWVFVPDYSNGSAPFGVWSARQLWTLTNYVNSGDLPDDIGAAVMNTDGLGRHIVNVVGGQGFAWNWPANLAVDDFGYPAGAPFNGQTLQFCNGNEFASPFVGSTIGLVCNFTGGSSGGPWLAFFDGTFGDVNGVNSYTTTAAPGEIFSPYFGNNAIALYNSVANL